MDWKLDDQPKELLTVGNPKTAKGEKLGYFTAIMHFAPANLSGFEVCSKRSAGCTAACLNTSGHGGINLDENGLNHVQAARIRRTRWFKNQKEDFMMMLEREIRKHIKLSEKHKLKPAVRLNGTSDLPWENVKAYRTKTRESFNFNTGKMDKEYIVEEFKNIFDAFPEVQFYDYTKFPIRLRQKAKDWDNYHLSFSLSEDNDSYAQEALAFGVNVVAVFDTKKKEKLPAVFMGHPVIDGDISDLRFTDPPGVIVGLRAKGRGRTDDTGFVRTVG